MFSCSAVLEKLFKTQRGPMPGFLLFCLWQLHKYQPRTRWSKELGTFQNSQKHHKSCHQRYVQHCLTLLYILSILVAPILYYFCISPSILNWLARLMHTFWISVFTYWYLYFLADSSYISDLTENLTTSNDTVQTLMSFAQIMCIVSNLNLALWVQLEGAGP